MTYLRVVKEWIDESEVCRPKEITVVLHGNGEYIATVILNEENEWSYIIKVDQTDIDGNEIVYEWTEHEVPGYKLKSITTVDSVTTIVNKEIAVPVIPPDKPQPKLFGKPVKVMYIENYATALGIQCPTNHVGDCFD